MLTPQGPPDGSGGARGRATGVAGSPHASRGCRRRHVRVNTTACTRPLERWAANPLALVAAGSSTMCWAESAHPRPRRRGAAGWMARATRKGTCGQTRVGAAAAWTGRRFSPACGDGSTRAANKISSVHSWEKRVHFARQSGIRWTPRARPPAWAHVENVRRRSAFRPRSDRRGAAWQPPTLRWAFAARPRSQRAPAAGS